MAKMNFTDSQIEAMIKGIEDGSITFTKLPLNYYEALVEYLTKGVLEGFSATMVDVIDDVFLQELVTNVHMFGAAKTYQQVKEINSLLVDDEGKLRSSREFNRVARETYDNWNDNWGRSEYNTAVAQSNAASKWKQIEAQKDVMPNLRYSAIGDACIICAPLDGIIANVDSSIWDKIAPTNHFGCKCVLLQEDETVSPTKGVNDIVNGVVDKMEEKGQDIFINNVGKTGEVFTNKHPYFDAPKDLGVNNFGLPLPKFDKP